jgi:hypothetical protein
MGGLRYHNNIHDRVPPGKCRAVGSTPGSPASAGEAGHILKGQSLVDSETGIAEVLAEEIADDLEAALEQFTAIASKLKTKG